MDYFIFQQINNLAGKWVCLDGLAIFFAKYLVYLLIVIAFLFFLRRRKAILQLLLAGFLSKFVIVDLIKFLWERPRPYVGNSINQILEYTGASFPSGHAALSFAVSVVVYKYNKKAGILFFVASFLISISRVFVGIHWPTDILAGALVGLFSGWLVLKISKRF
ncbi:MAG: phosphatase PAP2 family protein [Candidatus Beckwithbacteria bacterium]